MYRSLKSFLYVVPFLLIAPRFAGAYEGGQLKNHNHTSAAGDGGMLSNLSILGNLTVPGTITAGSLVSNVASTGSITGSSFTATGPMTASSFTATGAGFIFPDASIQTTASPAGALVAGSSPTIIGNWTFGGASTPTFNQGMKVGLTSDPTSPTEGQVWYNSTAHAVRYQNNSKTVELDPSYIVFQNVATAVTASYANAFCFAGNWIDNGGTTLISDACSTTEANVPGIAAVAGTVVKMAISATAPGCTGTITIRKNGSNTSMACTLAAGLTNTVHCENNTSFTVVSGDQLTFGWNASGCTASGIMVQTLVIQPSVQ